MQEESLSGPEAVFVHEIYSVPLHPFIWDSREEAWPRTGPAGRLLPLPGLSPPPPEGELQLVVFFFAGHPVPRVALPTQRSPAEIGVR